jgi:hypothetical protein
VAPPGKDTRAGAQTGAPLEVTGLGVVRCHFSRGGGTGLYEEIECVAVLYDVIPDELVVLRRRRWVSAGGAAGYACASCCSICAIESVGRMARADAGS